MKSLLRAISILLFCASIPMQQSAADDLRGSVDADGDGSFTNGDAIALGMLADLAPQVVDEALDQAIVTPQGAVDLSPVLGLPSQESTGDEPATDEQGGGGQ